MSNFQEKQASSPEIIRVYKCVHSGVCCDQALVSGVCSCQCVLTILDVWNALMAMALASIRIYHYFPGQGFWAINYQQCRKTERAGFTEVKLANSILTNVVVGSWPGTPSTWQQMPLWHHITLWQDVTRGVFHSCDILSKQVWPRFNH